VYGNKHIVSRFGAAGCRQPAVPRAAPGGIGAGDLLLMHPALHVLFPGFKRTSGGTMALSVIFARLECGY